MKKRTPRPLTTIPYQNNLPPSLPTANKNPQSAQFFSQKNFYVANANDQRLVQVDKISSTKQGGTILSPPYSRVWKMRSSQKPMGQGMKDVYYKVARVVEEMWEFTRLVVHTSMITRDGTTGITERTYSNPNLVPVSRTVVVYIQRELSTKYQPIWAPSMSFPPKNDGQVASCRRETTRAKSERGGQKSNQ